MHTTTHIQNNNEQNPLIVQGSKGWLRFKVDLMKTFQVQFVVQLIIIVGSELKLRSIAN